MTEQSLKEKTAKGLFWGGLSNGVQQLLNLFFGIFLSRILNAEDYGMVGMLSIFSLIAGSLQESGFTAALANKRDISHKDYNAVFWFSFRKHSMYLWNGSKGKQMNMKPTLRIRESYRFVMRWEIFWNSYRLPLPKKKMLFQKIYYC